LEQALQRHETAVSLRIYHAAQPYTVQYGETLSGIAYKFGFPYPWLEQANPNLGSNMAAGEVITIPSVDLLLPLPVVENKRIVVNMSQQKMFVYEAGQQKWVWPASTGIASSPTSPGIFQIQSHEDNAYAANWDLWMPNFMGIYRPVPYAEFMNGIHGFPSRNGSQILWTKNLGRPITYGCILISSDNAAELFKWAEAGVVVEIQP
jgi:lipoprotein-anchoring transpeptidase ErfK/SrfK